MALPDFLIIGAMKCGTSTLYAQLASQAGVFMTTPKEPNFFSDDDVFARGPDWYRELFKDAANGDLKGEASTHYTKLPTYPQTVSRMKNLLAAPKLIYMIRNPVERAVSHYIHERSEGRMENDPVAAFWRHEELVDYGRYAMQIAPFIDAFGTGQIFLTSLEQLKTAPGAELARITGFLGLATAPIWRPELATQNVSAERVRRLPLHRILVDNPVASALRRALVPKAIRTRIRNARSIGTRPELPDDLRARLQDIYAKDHLELARLFPGNAAVAASFSVSGT